MASHCHGQSQCQCYYPHQQNHHLLHNHHQQHQTCYSSSSYSSPPCHSHHSPPPTTTSDPLLQAIATQLLQSSSQSHLFSPYRQPQQHHSNHHHQLYQQPQTQPLITSLIHRIDALESSLHNLSSSQSPSPSLRDLAAKTIQTHFRAFLVGRSRTLRHLKHLALIKSNLNFLKSSLSNKTHLNYQTLSQKSMDLLHKLDSIQGGDPMIRDGKRSISRDLVQFMEFVDGVLVRRHQMCSKPRKNVKFADKISDTRVFVVDTTEEAFTSNKQEEQVCSDDQVQLLENLCRRVEKIEGLSRVYDEMEGDVEENSRNNVGNFGNERSHLQGQNGNCVFSPPMPVQMERREE